ncbi:MAG: hypothetical protein ACRDJY_08780 [Thermoleophilaceae bacterium]
MTRAREQVGFTIVEVMVAATILMVGILGTVAMLDTVSKRSLTAAKRQAAVGLVRDVLETSRQLPFRQVEGGSIIARLQEHGNLRGNGSTSDWKVERGRTTFSVRIEVCGVDDPADGTGSHLNAALCDGSIPPGTKDANPIDYKIVSARVSWEEPGGSKTVSEHVLITSGGRDRPGVANLSLTSPASPEITTPAITRASFSASTTVTADALVWSVDGSQQGSAQGDGRSWSFSWNLPAVDGAYEVSAAAYDASGISGTSRSLTITINRYPPSAPEDFFAGRNGSVVEIEWTPSPERDVIGYRVYRQTQSGAVEPACPLTDPEVAECVDASPPPEDNHWLRYWVVGVDRDPAGAEREGAMSAFVNVNANRPAPPAAPQDFAIVEDDEGNVTLTWTAVGSADSYRIYRDGFTIGDRYGRIDAEDGETEFDDPDPGIEPHQYWITAVDEFLQESLLVGPVTLAGAAPGEEPPSEPLEPDAVPPEPLP